MKHISILFLSCVLLVGCNARPDESDAVTDVGTEIAKDGTLKDAVDLEVAEETGSLEFDIIAEQRRRNKYVNDLWELWSTDGSVVREEFFQDVSTKSTVQRFLTRWHPQERYVILAQQQRRQCADLHLLSLLGPENGLEDAFIDCFRPKDDEYDEEPVPDFVKSLDDWQGILDDTTNIVDEICSNHKSSESCDV
jgi:hypothetical protein